MLFHLESSQGPPSGVYAVAEGLVAGSPFISLLRFPLAHHWAPRKWLIGLMTIEFLFADIAGNIFFLPTESIGKVTLALLLEYGKCPVNVCYYMIRSAVELLVVYFMTLQGSMTQMGHPPEDST